jgi:hypothetical protein
MTIKSFITFCPEDAAPQQPFTAFSQGASAVRQGRLPAESAEFPEVSRSQPANFRPAEEAPQAEAPAEAAKPAFNPNRARSNVRHQQPTQQRPSPFQVEISQTFYARNLWS